MARTRARHVPDGRAGHLHSRRLEGRAAPLVEHRCAHRGRRRGDGGWLRAAHGRSAADGGRDRARDGMSEPTADYAIAIVGGGLVGASLAIALGSLKLRTVVIEAVARGEPEQPSFDERTTALANGSVRMFQ